MSESFLQYIWKYQLIDKTKLFTVNNEPVQVITPGIQNTNAGPDFINARIKINDTLWAGNVEIHVHSSDWKKHKHHLDKNYSNVILQAVLVHDEEIKISDNEIIPTLILDINPVLKNNYENLLTSDLWIPCLNQLQNVDNFYVQFWLNKLSVERLEEKSALFFKYLQSNNNNFEESFYQFLARAFGFGLNALPFELLAQHTPLNILYKHHDQPLQTDALLFGQAGFLNNENIEDVYYTQLRNEYLFLQKKYNLKAIEPHLWKFLRLRPVNFPPIRIAQFASLMRISSNLFSKILEIKKLTDLEKLFEISLNNYWDAHYQFGKVSAKRTKNLGKDSVAILAINAIIPAIYSYGVYKNNINRQEHALNLLEQIEPEKNSITDNWIKAGIVPCNAAQSQALLTLKNNYCTQRRCTNCEIGHKLITLLTKN